MLKFNKNIGGRQKCRSPPIVVFQMLIDDFYNSLSWQRKRRAILKRDGYMCKRCRRYGKNVEASVVHHIKHLDEHPELALVDSNLISLCDKCHNKEHPEKGGARRY